MIPIDERVERAIQDLEGLLVEGRSVDLAVKSAAESYGLRPEVLIRRAQMALGDLAMVRARSESSRVSVDRKARTKRAVQMFREACQRGEAAVPAQWLQDKVGSLPANEFDAAIEECQQAWMNAQLSILSNLNGKQKC